MLKAYLYAVKQWKCFLNKHASLLCVKVLVSEGKKRKYIDRERERERGETKKKYKCVVSRSWSEKNQAELQKEKDIKKGFLKFSVHDFVRIIGLMQTYLTTDITVQIKNARTELTTWKRNKIILHSKISSSYTYLFTLRSFYILRMSIWYPMDRKPREGEALEPVWTLFS